MHERIVGLLDLRSGVLLAALFCSTLHAGSSERIFRSGFEEPASIQACSAATPLANGLGKGVIDPAGDVDYFAIDVVAGEWIFVDVSTNELNPERLDSVLTVYSGDGTQQLARNDDAILLGGTDSQLIHRVEQTGTVCLGVEDWTTVFGITPEGGPDFTYTLGATRLSFDDPGLNLDVGGNDSTAMPQTPLSYVPAFSGPLEHSAYIAGDFSSVSDVDVYEIVTPDPALRMEVLFHPSGDEGNGGTTPLGIVEILDSTGSTIIGRLDATNGADGLSLPANASSTYLLRVDSPPQALGSNPFYVLHFLPFAGENQQEANEPDNGAAVSAEAASPIKGPSQISHFIGGTLDASDVDWWSFQAGAGHTISVFCASQRNGSGVLDLTVALYGNPVSPPLQQAVETPFADLAWSSLPGSTMPPVQASFAGIHYLQLSASAFSPEVADRHYQCGIHVADGS